MQLSCNYHLELIDLKYQLTEPPHQTRTYDMLKPEQKRLLHCSKLLPKTKKNEKRKEHKRQATLVQGDSAPFPGLLDGNRRLCVCVVPCLQCGQLSLYFREVWNEVPVKPKQQHLLDLTGQGTGTHVT